MSKDYFLVLPNIFLEQSCSIGKLTLHRYTSEDENLGGNKNEELLKNIQQMLINNGFSGLFTYSYFNSDDQFEDVVLDVRKIMTIFRYVVFEEHPDFSLELLTYYLLNPQKLFDEIPEMKYSFEGIQDGTRYVHFYSPEFRTRRTNYPEIITLDSGHHLIDKFNTNDLEDKYIIAMERFNRTYKENHDPVEDILNLATAFEHIYKLKDGNKAELLARNLVQTFGLDGTPLAKAFGEWSRQFYETRGQISHGNAIEHYTKERSYDYWEECFKWKHPNGKTRYIRHVSIASKIFQLLIRRHSGEREILKIEQLEQMLTESEIEPLITPNEVYYKELHDLVNSGIAFGEPYYNIIQKIKQCDGTEEKSVLFELLPFFLNVIINRYPELKKECEEIISLAKRNDTRSISLRIFELSQKTRSKVTEPLVINDVTFMPLCLSGFFEKVYYQLTNIALREMSTK